MGLKISLCKFYKKNLSERLLEGKAVSPWCELTELKAVSQKASFQFLTEDIFFVTIALYGRPIISLQIPQEQSSRKASWGKAVTLWDELTDHKAVFQKSSFQFVTEDISFFTIALYGLPNITLQITQEEPYRKASWGESLSL